MNFEFWEFYLGKEGTKTGRTMYESLAEDFQKFKETHYEFTDLVICSNQGD